MRNPKTNTSILTPFLLAILTIGLGFGILGTYGMIKTATAEETIDVSDVDVSHDIENLTREIDLRRSRIREVEQKRKELEDQLNIIQRQTYSLQRQISAIDTQIQDTEFEIQKKVIEIEQRNLEIERLTQLIEEKQVEVNDSKGRLSSLIRVIDQNDRESHLFILFSRDSFSTYLDDLRSAADLQVNIQEEVQELKEAKQQLDDQKLEQEEISKKLQESRESLERNRETLDQQRTYQGGLLAESKEQEIPFKDLIQQIQSEEDNASAQVRTLENAVREKILELNQGLISDKNVPLSWPVIKEGLSASSCASLVTCSATFQDSDYYNIFRRNHFAVDIPMPQGSPVYAPADGYVTGLIPGYAGAGGLSVLTIQHTDDVGIVTDMKTRYLHMSSFQVRYDPNNPQFVRKGELVGYSGGKCGTVGAGTCRVHTTGAHLHFEVWIGASVVNPLNYLP